MLIHNAEVTGSLKVNNVPFNSGSFSGSFRGDGSQLTGITGASTASYVEYSNVGNKPALVSGSSQITYSGISGIPSGIVSGSSQVSFNGIVDKPTLVSGSSQVTYSGLSGIPAGIVSGSAQVAALGFATTGSNTFQANQTITGSLFITQNLVVAGSSSIQYISSSVLDIADNIITVNAFNPAIRFGGLAVIDSGSSPQVSGSILFDSIKDQWIFVHQNQSVVTSSVVLMGPETYNDLGNESYISANRLPKGSGVEHLRDSNITDTGTVVSINSNTAVTGSFTVVSGSAVELQVTNLGVNIGSALTDAHTITGSLGINGQGAFYQPLTNSTAYLTVQNNRARNAAVYTQTTNGGFYAGTSIGTDTFNYQIYDGVAGSARLTISSTGAATFSSSVTATANSSGRSGFFGGTSFGLRIDNSGSFNNGGSIIHGVDNTFVASYQKLSLNGSSLEFMTDYGTKLTIANSGAATFTSGVTATSFEVGNGQFFKARRSSSNLLIDLLGIESGTDNTRLLITGDFNIKNGSLATLFNMTTAGAVTLGANATGDSNPYSITILRNGTLASPGTWLSTPAIKVEDISGDGPGSLSTTSGLLQLNLGRIADNDTNASNAMFINCINDNGVAFVVTGKRNVGIGTNTGFNSVSGTETTLHISNSNAASLYLTSTAANKYAIYSAAAGNLQVFNVTQNSYPLGITSGGNVGIGITTPFSRLHVTNSDTLEGTIAIGNSLYPGLIFSSATTGEFRIDNRSSAGGGYISFYPNGQNTTLGSEAMRITTGGNVLIGETSPPSFSTPSGGKLLMLPNAVIVSGIIALGSPYTQNIQIDIVYNNWGGNNVIGLVDMIITLREFANVSGTAFGKVFATNSGSGSTFASFNTSNVTTSQCSVTATSGGNYTLRITIDPSNVTDRGSFYLTIPNAGGTGSTINSITVSYV